MKLSSNKYDSPFFIQSIRNKDDRNYKQKWKIGNKPLASNEPFFFSIQPETTGFCKMLAYVYTHFKMPFSFHFDLRNLEWGTVANAWPPKVFFFSFLFYIPKILWDPTKMAIAWIKLSQCFLVLKCISDAFIFPRTWPIVKKKKKQSALVLNIYKREWKSVR